VGWCYRGVERERLEEWFREMRAQSSSQKI
jgi:hypothetical protein